MKKISGFIPKKRVVLSILILALVFIYGLFWIADFSEPWFKVYENFFIEAIGIALTVVFVQYLFEIVQRSYDLESIAWDVLHDADYIIWVWRGGDRSYFYNELEFLLKTVNETDEISEETQNLIIAFGNKCSNLKNTNRLIVKSKKKFVNVLTVFSELARIRDKKELMKVCEIADIFLRGIKLLSEIIKIDRMTTDIDESKIDSSKSEQLWRHTGTRLSSTDRNIKGDQSNEVYRRMTRSRETH